MKLLASWRRVLAATVLTVSGAVAATGCGTAEAGSAAVVGSEVLSESQVAAYVQEINEITGAPQDEPNAQLVLIVVNRNVQHDLVAQAGIDADVVISAGEIDAAYQEVLEANGGEEQLLAAAAQSGIAPSMIKRDIETQLIALQLGERVNAELSPQEQQQVLIQALGQFSEEIGVEVAPKYGQWNPAELSIAPPENPVSKRVEPLVPEDALQIPAQ